MRTSVLTVVFSLWLIPALPAFSQQRVTADELEHILATAQNRPDAELAGQLSNTRLTERFSSARLARWRSALSGPRAQHALLAIADRSAFLAPPSSEAPAQAPPDLDQQRRIMGLAATYVSKAIAQLPRFVATRTVTHFESAAATAADSTAADFGALQAMRLTRAVVEYREGQEIVDSGPTKVAKHGEADQGLRTWGVFGPILTLVLLDAAQNQLTWSHWEQSPAGPLAVFHYAVAREKSDYEIRYCCVLSSYGLESHTFQQMSGYHGEIGVDPETGTILRLQLEADLSPGDPISRADVLVEYSSVELGGKTYFCPTHSISISVARTLRTVQEAGGHGYPAMGPPQMLLNHADFDQYHLFRGESRVLSASEERTSGMAPDATLPAAQAEDAKPSEEILAETPTTSPAEASSGEAPEISAATTTQIPDAASHAREVTPAPQPTGYTLHINARLVDVNVVALDKKGHPIAGLKREDFEIYDNGVKQDVRSFSQASSETEAQIGAPETTPVAAPMSFSNRSAGPSPANAGQGSSAGTGNTLVFVVDPSNLVYNDLVDARRQMLDFLKKLPAEERVALYVMRYHGFQVLEEATTDHARVATRLAKWTPSAQDLLNARDQENRNRQTMETVHSPEDLLSVNGSYTLDSQTQQVALDPKLREMGSNPGPNGLDVLVDVAQHLAPMPGHKSVVWVTSDNALADWNRMSVSIQKHSKFIEPIALRTQEAMNNAHASVYPLDASRLEASVINASTGNRNVELTPTYQMPAYVEHEEEGTEMQAGLDVNKFGQGRDLRPGRLTAQMQQDMRPIEGVFREVAEATGGKAFRRSSNIEGELNGVVAESHATYLLGFSPALPADGKYHLLTVKLVGHRDATLRYRTGYQYDKEPATLKERFAHAVWQPTDSEEIAISARPVSDAAGQALRVTIAGADLDLDSAPLQQQTSSGAREIWSGKLDIFLVQRDETGRKAHITGQTVGLHLKPPTYQHALAEGLTFDQRIKPAPGTASLRVVVVDVNSGRIGSVTVPTSALAPQSN